MDDELTSFYSGQLEKAYHYLDVKGLGSIRPVDAIELAEHLCRIEETTGHPPKWADLDLRTQDLIDRFARWEPGGRYGSLADMVVSEARRLVAEASLS